ncbi:putative Ig domain-containing protein [Actinoplanes sp. NPDC051411]|uniref:putative Ig domain-containing protein n=1 Tax=Actinoplanes sp. NPDC051411 TaxID=3155522 RepID=UPI00342EF908
MVLPRLLAPGSAAAGRGGKSRRLVSVAVLAALSMLLTFIVSPPAFAATSPVVTNPGSQYSGVNLPASLQAAASGGTAPYTWSATGLPPGLGVNSSTGLVSGTPTVAGTYAAKLTASDRSSLTGSASFTWVTGVAATVANPGTVAGVKGTLVSKTITATGGRTPYVWSATGLPPGVSINSSTGVVSGTPTIAAVSTVKVTATDANKIPGSTSFSFDVAAAAPAVTNPGTRQGTVGRNSSLSLAATGGTAPYTWTVTGLPAGLTLNSTAGAVTGTPTSAGTSGVSAKVTDSVGRTATGTFSWVVAVAPAVTNPGTLTGTVGVAVSRTMTATGGTTPYTWTAIGLPAGVSINSSTGVITGTPTTAGTSSVTLTATDTTTRAGSSTFTWTVETALTVVNPGTQQSTIGQPVTVTLSAAGGTSPYTWSATGLPAGLSISTSGVITGTPTAATTSSVVLTVKDTAGRTATANLSWVTATGPSVANPGPLTGTIGAAVATTVTATGGRAPYTWSASALPAGLSLNASSGAVTGTPTTAGTTTVTITAKDADGRTGATSFTWAIATPVTLTDPGPQNSTTGVTVSTTLTATGGTSPYTFTATGLPAGLAINPATGVVTGSPTTTGTTTTALTVTDTLGRTASARVAWTIAAPLTLTDPGPQIGTVGKPTTVTLTATGGTSPYTFTATGLPDGLSINPATGTITGSPSTPGPDTAAVQVTDTAGRHDNITVRFSIAGPVTITDPGTQNATTGESATLTLTAAGGDGTYTFAASGLPDGLALDPATGTIAGTPTGTGTSTVTVKAIDGAGRADTLTLTWIVTAPVTIADPGTQHGVLETAAVLTPNATGGSGHYKWTATGLPDGLTLAPATGTITGSPTTAGGFTTTLTATDDQQQAATISFGWQIGLPVALSAPADQNGTLGQPVSMPNLAAGGTAPYAFTATGLPAGLTIDPASGTIAGTPTTVQNTVVTVTATDTTGAASTVSFTWIIAVVPALGPVADMASTTGTPADGHVTATGGITPYTFTATGLPDGVTLDPATGAFGGAATTASTTAVTVTVADAGGRTAKTTLNYKAYAALPQSPIIGQGKVVHLAAVANANGVTVLHGNIYTGVADKVVKIGADGVPHDLAGGGTGNCDGADVKLGATSVFANDGTFIYASTASCGIVTIEPDTGAVKRVAPGYLSASQAYNPTLAGHYLYTEDTNWNLNRTDLTSGRPAALTSVSPYAVLVADDDNVWDTQANLTKYPLAGGAQTTTRISGQLIRTIAVGNYLYGVNGNTLDRLDKRDLTTRIVAGLGAHDDPPLYNITGLAADDGKLYVADSYGISEVIADALTATQTNANTDLWKYGQSNTLNSSLPAGAAGMTALNGMVYTGASTEILKTDIKTGVTETFVGGAATGGCDTANGAAASFKYADVLGNDGHLIYASTSCGVIAITPSGALHTIPFYSMQAGGAVGGHYLYLEDSWQHLVAYDLETGTAVTLGTLCAWCYITADDTNAWEYDYDSHQLIKITAPATRGIPVTADPTAFTVVSTSTSNDGNESLWGLTSMGGYIYLAQSVPIDGTTTYQTVLAAMSKTDGSYHRVQTLTTTSIPIPMWGGQPGGLTADESGKNLFVIDIQRSAWSLLNVSITTDPATDPNRYITADTIFVPSNNQQATVTADGNDLLPDGPRISWDPSTGLCVTNCDAIHVWRQKIYDAHDSVWKDIDCTVLEVPVKDPIGGNSPPVRADCTPEQYEKAQMAAWVTQQDYFNFSDGSLSTNFKLKIAESACIQSAVNLGSCTLANMQDAASRAANNISEVLGSLAIILGGGKFLEPGEYPEFVDKAFDELPPFISKTRGIAYGENGVELDPENAEIKERDGVVGDYLISGDFGNISGEILDFFRVNHPELLDSEGNLAATSHTEAKVAWWMRKYNVKQVDLVINNPDGVCGGPLSCDTVLDKILRPDQTLRVWSPANFTPDIFPKP